MRVQHKSHPCGFLESAGDAVGEDRVTDVGATESPGR